MARRRPDLIQVVVLARDAQHLLRRRRARVGAPLQPEEGVLELDHPRVGEEQRRVVARHQRGARHLGVTALGEEVEVLAADLVPAQSLHTLLLSLARAPRRAAATCPRSTHDARGGRSRPARRGGPQQPKQKAPPPQSRDGRVSFRGTTRVQRRQPTRRILPRSSPVTVAHRGSLLARRAVRVAEPARRWLSTGRWAGRLSAGGLPSLLAADRATRPARRLSLSPASIAGGARKSKVSALHAARQRTRDRVATRTTQR